MRTIYIFLQPPKIIRKHFFRSIFHSVSGERCNFMCYSFSDRHGNEFILHFLVWKKFPSKSFLLLFNFQMNPTDEIINFIFYLSYFMTLSTEIFLPCYFGTELLLKNADLTTAIYSSNWMDCPLFYQKMVSVFMEYTKSPRYLVAGKVFNLSLANFLLVG